jgi:type IV pilus assembly protein PilP
MLAAVLLAGILSACTGDMNELSRYIEEVKQRPADPIEPIPPVATYTPHLYASTGQRNPFLSEMAGGDSPAEADEGDGLRPDATRAREYLEQFSLDTLSMVGTLSRGGADWSLIRDPDGVIHRVATNNYIGQNHGRVTSVYPDRIELTELITNGSGGWLERNTSVAMDDS